MSVSADDVRHIATLARLGVSDARVPLLVEELNGILRHMEALARVPTRGEDAMAGAGPEGMPLRADVGPQIPLERPREDFAPAMRDGFFLVPRLATHEDTGAESSA